MRWQRIILASLVGFAVSLCSKSTIDAAEQTQVNPNDVLNYSVVRNNLDKASIVQMLGDQEEIAFVGAFAAAYQGETGAKILADFCAKEPVNLSAIFEGITRAGSNAFATLPLVTKYLSHEKPGVRKGAIRALTAIRSRCPDAIEPLKKLATNSSDRTERVDALLALGIAARGREDVAAWLMKASKEHPEFESQCITALSAIGPAAKEAVPLLIECVKAKKYFANALSALGEIGVDAREAIPVLLPLLKEKPRDVQLCLVLRKLGDASPELVEALTAATASKSSDEQIAALRELATLGLSAKPALPQIKQLLTHQEPEVRLYAAYAWERIEGIKEQQIKTVCEVIEIAVVNEKLNASVNFGALFNAIVFLAANSESASTSQEIICQVIANSEKERWNEIASYAAMTLLKLNKLSETSKTALRDYSVMEHTDPALRLRIAAFLSKK